MTTMIVPAQSALVAHGRSSVVGLVRMSVDPLLIVVSLLLACAITGREFRGAELVAALIAFSLTFPGEVSMARIRRGLLRGVVLRWLGVAGVLLFFGYATRFIGHFDARMVLTWLVLTPLLQYAAHRAIPWLVPQLLAIDGFRSAVVVSANDIGRKLARHLNDEPSLGFRFTGFFGEPDQIADTRDLEGPLLGGLDDVARHVKAGGIEAIFVALPMHAQPQVLRLLDDLKDTTASIYFVPDIFIFDLIQARIDDVNGIPVVAVCETPFVGVNGMLKRASDLLFAAVALLLCAPVMVAAAAAVKMTSPGPVIFRQRRYGVDGRQIVVYKFRSMTVTEDGSSVAQARKGDQRITPVGAFLRRTSIDELPQLVNVLQGRMSMVGPRPHAVAHNELYRGLIKGYMMRHKVKPGITGWAQVNGLRGETETVEKMRQRIEFDLDYLRRWSIGLDLAILARTVRIVLAGTNAH